MTLHLKVREGKSGQWRWFIYRAEAAKSVLVAQMGGVKGFDTEREAEQAAEALMAPHDENQRLHAEIRRLESRVASIADEKVRRGDELKRANEQIGRAEDNLRAQERINRDLNNEIAYTRAHRWWAALGGAIAAVCLTVIAMGGIR